ncbi:MAG: DNA mismatch repair protein MutS, partial [Mangrovicoccus sp.]|nr:DNA mismatch repair protein MutS [Mangrovicoccus sp.]
RPGAADRSYGVQVAKLAGLPETVVARARSVLETLERSDREGGGRRPVIDDLPLFARAPVPPPTLAKADPLGARIDALQPDRLTPIEALQLIYELKSLRGAPPGTG